MSLSGSPELGKGKKKAKILQNCDFNFNIELLKLNTISFVLNGDFNTQNSIFEIPDGGLSSGLSRISLVQTCLVVVVVVMVSG